MPSTSTGKLGSATSMIRIPAPWFATNANGPCSAACIRTDADIDWHEVTDDVWEAQQSGAPIRVAVIETKGLAGWQHKDLAAKAWTNSVECFGSSGPCPIAPGKQLPECVAGESRSDSAFGKVCPVPQSYNGPPPECEGCHILVNGTVVPLHPYKIPTVRRCLLVGEGADVGDPCVGTWDCGLPGGGTCFQLDQAWGSVKVCTQGNVGLPCQDDGDCDTIKAVCGETGGYETCTAGYPGFPGVDDDGDGYTDFEDPEVLRLLKNVLTNQIDDDVSGFLPIWNSQGPGGPGETDDLRERLLLAFDDDENGHLDDIHMDARTSSWPAASRRTPTRCRERTRSRAACPA